MGLLDYNIILLDARDIILCSYFIIYSYIVLDYYSGIYLIVKSNNDTTKKVSILLKIWNSADISTITKLVTTHSFKNLAINDMHIHSVIYQ